MTFGDRLTTLDTLWAAWAEQGRATTEEQWVLPTRLGAWDVRSLYAHASSWPRAFTSLVTMVREAEPTYATAAELLRVFNAPDGVAHRMRDWSAARSREEAAKYSTAELVEQFAVAGPQAITTARELGDVAVDYYGQAVLHLDAVVSIGVMEATVHLLDLQNALGQAPDVPSSGLTQTAALLAEMAPPVTFIEAATGRSTTSPFPVLT